MANKPLNKGYCLNNMLAKNRLLILLINYRDLRTQLVPLIYVKKRPSKMMKMSGL